MGLRDFEMGDTYLTLAWLLHKLKDHLNEDTVKLLLAFVGLSAQGNDGLISNIRALQSLILDSSLWVGCSSAGLTALLQSLNASITTNSNRATNIQVLLNCRTMQWVLSLLSEEDMSLRSQYLLALRLLSSLSSGSISNAEETLRLVTDSAIASFIVSASIDGIPMMLQQYSWPISTQNFPTYSLGFTSLSMATKSGLHLHSRN